LQLSYNVMAKQKARHDLVTMVMGNAMGAAGMS
jgi:uncharacterized protein YejL (UPF0352 family)